MLGDFSERMIQHQMKTLKLLYDIKMAIEDRDQFEPGYEHRKRNTRVTKLNKSLETIMELHAVEVYTYLKEYTDRQKNRIC